MNPFQFGSIVRIKLAETIPMPAPTISLSGPSKLPTSSPPSSTMSLARLNQMPQAQTVSSGSGFSNSNRAPQPPAQSFGEFVGETAQNALGSQTGQRMLHGMADFGQWYNKKFSPETRQTFNDMSSNSARIMGGALSSLAGGVGVVGTGAVAGLTNAWNAMTPKSMNTSTGWSQGANNVFNKTVDFTNAGARDVAGGLGGDKNYDTQHSWNQIQEGINDSAVDDTSRNVANTAGWGGHIAGNIGAAYANPSKILSAIPRVGQYAGAAGNVGRILNRVDDFGATTFELGNAAGNMGGGLADARAAAQPEELAMNNQEQPNATY